MKRFVLSALLILITIAIPAATAQTTIGGGTYSSDLPRLAEGDYTTDALGRQNATIYMPARAWADCLRRR